MKIGIDARLIHETGVGRYIRNLISQLKQQDTKNHYIIYLPEKSYSDFQLPNQRWEKRLVQIRWHTLLEQCVMPFLLLRDNLDLLHVPYFNVPIFYPKKYIVTIHDLTILHFMTGKASTLPYYLYIIRKAGYRIVLGIGLRRAVRIIAPSQTTKQEIIDHYPFTENKISVTYEGVDKNLNKDFTLSSGTNSQKLKTDIMKHPYFLYIGNAYPHKNLEMLILAFADFMRSRRDGNAYRLICVGKEDYFYKRLKAFVIKHGLDDHILFLANIDDSTLRTLYKNARALVLLSLMEGFGLPALEALSLGTPALCSDIPIFHEILKNIPVFVNPNNRDDIVTGLQSVADTKNNTIMRQRDEITSLLKKYSWEELGRQTIACYQETQTHENHV